MHVLLKSNLKSKVCFFTNLLVVKIKQVVRLNVQIKSDCLISLLVINQSINQFSLFRRNNKMDKYSREYKY